MSFAIFFSPSEDKKLDIDTTLCNDNVFFLKNLWQGKILYDHRKRINDIYKDTMRQILHSSDKSLLQKVYGAKSFNAKVEYNINMCINQYRLMPAIERYIGTGFKGLSFASLNEHAKSFICNYIYIFSNLFGIIKADDNIPYYKLKQLTPHPILSLDSVYSAFIERFAYFDNMDFIIDLRASVYKDLYKPTRYITCEFIKDNKIISHYAKLYRGKVLRYIALHEDFHSNVDYTQAISIIENIQGMRHMYTKYSNNATTICLSID